MTKVESGACVGEWHTPVCPSVPIHHLPPLVLHLWFPGVLEPVAAVWVTPSSSQA